MSNAGLPARRAAVSLLHAVLLNKHMIAEVLDSQDSPLNDLSPQDRARAQSLALSVLRNLDPIDAVLDTFLQKSPPLRVRNILRVAANELLIDGIAPHACVDSAVRMVRESQKTQHMSGLTNAVARRIADKGPEIYAEQGPQAMPNWIAKPIERVYGEPTARAIERIHAKGAPLDITVKTPADREKWAETLEAEILPTGSLRIQTPGQVSRLAGYEEGEWWVQDAAAALPVHLLGGVDGQDVLDLCAAPGGKTMQLAAAGAKVTSVDVSGQRLKRVRENLDRTKLKARLLEADVMKWQPGGKFDAILLDAPCSATGTLRRHPDLPYAKDGELSGLLKLQLRMLTRAFDWLKPGGRIVYCTCSLLASEGEEQIARFLETRPDTKLIPATDLPAEFLSKQGELRTLPSMWEERGGVDGFYAAAIQKP